ncbi:MAG: hypothetical protein HYX33_00775 [Actinobacteria bacterium]|nr:hypothetical protein [Actinomycetota bacterium]
MNTASPSILERDIQRLADALGDPTRRRIFFTARDADDAVTKDDIARAVGVDRRLAGFHLDKLVEQGYLTADFARPPHRRGPGAGRPAKHYRLAEAERVVGLPERHYELLASLLLKAMHDPGDGDPQHVLERVGYDFGRELGEAELAEGRRPHDAHDAVKDVVRLLSRYGFAARADADDTIRACACPFEEMAFRDPERICGLDRAIWRGVIAAFSPASTILASTARARGDDACVVVVAGGE